MSHRLFLASCLAILTASAANAEIPSFKRRGDIDKAFASKIGETIVLAAHRTAQKVTYSDHSYTEVDGKKNRKQLKIVIVYSGRLTGKRYIADIVIAIDSSSKEWEALNIKYKDNNNIPANLQAVQELVDKLNR